MINHYILIGFMGTGKTTVGKLLSEITGYDFFDMDETIEKQEGMNISDIFKNHGEKYFRELEEKLALDLINKDNTIISTGGGAVMNPVIFTAFKNKGAIINLECSFDILWERIKDCAQRPLISRNNSKEKLYKLYCERQKVYRNANYIIRCDNKPPIVIVNEIINTVK